MNSNEAALNTLVSHAINDHIFPKKQFIILEQELDVNGKVATKTLAALGMEKSRWPEVKEIVRKRMGNKRNNSQTRVRKSLMGKLQV